MSDDPTSEYRGPSRRTRIFVSLLTPLPLAGAILFTRELWSLRLALALFAVMCAVYPFDPLIRVRARGLGLTFHHLFELPAMLLFGLFLGQTSGWVSLVEVGLVLVLIMVPLDHYASRRYTGKSDVRETLRALGYFLGIIALGYAVGLFL